MPTTLLGNLIGSVESGNALPDGPWTRPGTSQTYTNGLFQQFSGFSNQYGSGEAGLTNYANQVLAANPNATLGDLYGGYFGGTGNPANASTSLFGNWGAAGTQASANWDRTLSQNGYSQSTPLASVLNGTATPSTGAAGLTDNDIVDPDYDYYSNASPAAQNAYLASTDTSSPSIPDSSWSLFDSEGGSGTVGYNATTGAGSGLTSASAGMFSGTNTASDLTGSSVTMGATTPTSAASAAAGGGGINVNLTDETQLAPDVAAAGKSVQAGAGTIGSDVTGAATGIVGTATSAFNNLQTYFSSAVVVTALVVMGLIFVAFGLSMFKHNITQAA